MTKIIAAKGLAAAGLPPASGASIPKAVVVKAPAGPPGKAAPKRPGRPPKHGATSLGKAQPAPRLDDNQPASSPGDAKLAPVGAAQPARQYPVASKPKPSLGALCNALADSTGLDAEEVRNVLKALNDAAAKSLRDHNVFRLPDMVLLRYKKTPARAEGMKKAFGKEIHVAAKPAGRKITAVVVKQLRGAAAASESAGVGPEHANQP